MTDDSEESSMMETMPQAVRRFIESILIAGAVAGAITSVLTLISFLGRLIFMQDAWAWMLEAARALPDFAINALLWISWAGHRVVDAYRETIYPIMQWLVDQLPFDIVLSAWVIDTFFVFVFSIISAWRIREAGDYFFGEGVRYWRSYGMYVPFLLITELGVVLVKFLNWLIGFGRLNLPFHCYKMLPRPIGNFLFAALAVSAVLTTLLLSDAIYQAVLR